ncbi:MAG: hypothetical protein PHC90_13995 [Syntrophorhabdaceae bacterium]|nr:hypothetical protein [Syntrophorhabdaceae bacterium]
MSKRKYIDINVDDDKKAEYLAILNSDYFDNHPGDDLETAFEILHGDGVSSFYDDYPFTHEQAREIKMKLKGKYDHKDVTRFIMKLRFVLEGAACLLDQTDSKTYRNDRKSMLAILEKSYKLLDAIRQGQVGRIPNYTVLLDDDLSELDGECRELARTTGDLLSVLVRKMKKLNELIEQQVKRSAGSLHGRPTADSKGIVKHIAMAWEEAFREKPTQYPDSDFADVLKIALIGLNLTHEYPRRKLKDALKK